MIYQLNNGEFRRIQGLCRCIAPELFLVAAVIGVFIPPNGVWVRG